ncbi:hypothetical protein D3C81_1907470 [compost metagenome]
MPTHCIDGLRRVFASQWVRTVADDARNARRGGETPKAWVEVLALGTDALDLAEKVFQDFNSSS